MNQETLKKVNSVLKLPDKLGEENKSMPIKCQDLRNLYGGLDYRISYNSESDSPYKDIMYDVSAPLYWTSSQNVWVVNGILEPMLGNTPLLATKITGGILGMFDYEVANSHYLIFNGGDGQFYLFNGTGVAPTVLKTGLSITASCNYTQFLQKAVVCNGTNEAFIYDKTTNTVTNTGIFAVRGVNGQVCCSYASRLWIADGANLYYSDLGDPTQWVDDPSNNLFGGYINNFMGNTDNITWMENMGPYMVIGTSNHIYLLSGNDTSSFAIEGFDNVGTSSPTGGIHFNGNEYFFNNKNLNLTLITGKSDEGQLHLGASLTDKIHINLATLLDLNSLNTITIVPYPAKNQIWMYVKQNNVDNLSLCYIFDFQYYNQKQLVPIYLRVGTPATTACNYNAKVYTGTSSGQIYLEDTGNTFGGDYNASNGSWYKFYTNFPKMELGQASVYKTIEGIKFLVNSSRTNNFNIELAYQGIVNNVITIPVNVPNNIFNLGSDYLGSGKILGQNTDLPVFIPSGADFQSIAIGISGTSVQNDFGIRMFSLSNIQDLQSL